MNTDTTEVRDTRFFRLEVDDPRWPEAARGEDHLFLWFYYDVMGAAGRELPIHFKAYTVKRGVHGGVQRYEFALYSILPDELEVLGRARAGKSACQGPHQPRLAAGCADCDGLMKAALWGGFFLVGGGYKYMYTLCASTATSSTDPFGPARAGHDLSHCGKTVYFRAMACQRNGRSEPRRQE